MLQEVPTSGVSNRLIVLDGMLVAVVMCGRRCVVRDYRRVLTDQRVISQTSLMI
eukprot:m.14720 g.14720  ORF g.14720 m.14720 type:complete len:54 (+) comp10260_c0_seq1:56-217(+)